MIHPDKSVLRKSIALSALGMGLQMAGCICMFAATLGAAKEVNRQIKKAIVEELSKGLGETDAGHGRNGG